MRTSVLPMVGLLLSGCIGGVLESGPQPGAPWKGPTAPLALPATQPADDVPLEWATGLTSVPPDRVMARARAVMEPAYGELKYVKKDIPNSRTLHLLLTPRYNVSNRGQDYRWLQVTVNYNPCDGRSEVEVEEFERYKRLVMAGMCGGVWLFPPTMEIPHRALEEYRLLVSIIRGLDDPGALITARQADGSDLPPRTGRADERRPNPLGEPVAGR
jgi:hypothetical protein